jgi:ABC-2 type transport system permease protein
VSTRVAGPRRVPDEPLSPPGGSGGLLDVFRRRYLLRLLVGKELKARYQGSVLGLLWSYVKPAVRFAMYYLVMGIILEMDRRAENFAIHLFAGMVFVHYFTETFASGTRSIVKNRALVQKMALPREMFPVASMLVSAYHTGPQLLILLAGALATGWSPDLAGLGAGLLGFTIIAVFGMALALLFSAANVFFRDFQNIVETFSIFVTWSVPMIYPFSLVKASFGGTWVETLYLANPIAEAVLLLQRCFWVSTTSDPAETIRLGMPDDLYVRGAVILGVSLVFLAVAQWAFTRLETKFAERL